MICESKYGSNVNHVKEDWIGRAWGKKIKYQTFIGKVESKNHVGAKHEWDDVIKVDLKGLIFEGVDCN